MALDTNIVHPESGGVALVEKEAFDKIYSRKGWKIATPAEANAEAQRLIAERDEALKAQAEASAAQTEAEMAAAGALPVEDKPAAKTTSTSKST